MKALLHKERVRRLKIYTLCMNCNGTGKVEKKFWIWNYHRKCSLCKGEGKKQGKLTWGD